MEKKDWGKYMVKLVLLLSLFVNSVTDLRQRKLFVLFVLFPLPVLITGLIVQEEDVVFRFLQGFVVWLTFLGIARITGQLGEGDAMLLGVVAVGLTTGQTILFLMLSFLNGFLAALFLVVFFRKGKNLAFPFVPAMLIAYLFLLTVEGEV